MKQIDLTKGKVWQSLMALALPLMGSSLLQFTYNLVDTLFVGHLGSDSVASVGSSSFFLGLGYALNALVVIGTGVKVAHSVGRGKQEEVKAYTQAGMSLNLVIGIFYMLFLLFLGKQLIGFLSLESIEVEHDAYLYLAWSAPMLVFSFFNTLFARILGSIGNTKSPLKINATGLMTNIVLDPILIYGVGWGVTGAAIGTLIAHVIMFICYIRLGKGLFELGFIKKFAFIKEIFSKNIHQRNIHQRNIHQRNIHQRNVSKENVHQEDTSKGTIDQEHIYRGNISQQYLNQEDIQQENIGKEEISKEKTRERMKEIVALGFPIAFQRILFSMVNIILAKMVAQFGAEAIAAQKIGLQIESVVYMVTGGLNGAVASFIGQNYGAKASYRIRKGYQTALRIGTVYAVASACFFLLLPKQLAGLFVRETETILVTASYLKVIAYSQLFNAIEMVSSGFFTGIGKPKVPASVSMIFTALRIPMAGIMMMALGINGIWWAISLSTILKGMTLYMIYHWKAQPAINGLK